MFTGRQIYLGAGGFDAVGVLIKSKSKSTGAIAEADLDLDLDLVIPLGQPDHRKNVF